MTNTVCSIMDGVHMGQAFKKALERKGLTVLKIATELKVDRRTIYNWFKQRAISNAVLDRISKTDCWKVEPVNSLPIKADETIAPLLKEYDELYWKKKYDLLLKSYLNLLSEVQKVG